MIDSSIFIGFLIINIIFGLISGNKISNLKEYAIGNKDFSTATISATIIATYLSGSGFFSNLSRTYDDGLYYMWASIASSILVFLSIAFIFAPRMGEFLGKLSIADAMGEIFGKEIRIITSVAGFLASAAFISMQLKVAGKLFEYGLDLSPTVGVIIIGLIITGYSSFGGIKAVTFTDVIQFLMFGTIIPTIAYFVISSMNNINPLINIIQNNELFNYQEVFNFSNKKSLWYLSLFLVAGIPCFCPTIFQRISMAKNINQVISSHIIACFICVIIKIISCFISLLVLSHNSNLQGSEVLTYILDNYSYAGLRGLTLVGIMAMVMSTVDSEINATSVLFVHDFCKPLGWINFIQNDLHSVRLVSFIIGVLSIYFAVIETDLIKLLILANTFFVPIVTAPFMMAIFGFRPHKICVLNAMAAGALGTAIWEFGIKNSSIASLLPGLLLNFIVLISSHYILRLPGGWVGIKDEKSLREAKQMQRLKISDFIYNVKNFNLYNYFLNNNLKSEESYLYFGMFYILTCVINMSTLSNIVQVNYNILMKFIHISVVILGTIIIICPLFASIKQKPKYQLITSCLWNFSVFYILICVGFFLMLITNLAPIQVISFMLNLLILFLTLRLGAFSFMLMLGLGITFKAFQLLHVEDSSLIFMPPNLQLIYLILFIGVICIFFLKPKEEYIDSIQEQVKDLNGTINCKNNELKIAYELKGKFINNVIHEYNTPLTGTICTLETISEKYESLTADQLKLAFQNAYKNAKRLSCYQNNITTLHSLAKPSPELNIKQFNLSNLILKRLQICQQRYADQNNKTIFDNNIENNVIIYGDQNLLTQVIDNLITNSINYCKTGKVNIALISNLTEIIFSIMDNGIGVPDIELISVFEEFTVGSRTNTGAEGRGIGLSVCKRVIEAHGGKIWAENLFNDCFTTFKFQIPLTCFNK